MCKILCLLVLSVVFVFTANAQIPIQFAKGASEKTLTVTVPAKGEKQFSIAVKKDQVINFGVSGDINVSKTTEFPVISINLTNGVEDVDNWQDGEGYLSILAGKNGVYIVSIANSDKKRARTFTLKAAVSNNKDDYQGGTEFQ